MATPEERFWAKVEKTDTCWLWTACCNDRGYGLFSVAGRLVQAHRFAYELLVGPIPEGLELDHVRDRGCRHRRCCNPAHLEAVTHAENVRRSDATLTSIAAAKTHCRHGHPFDAANTYVDRYGHRICIKARVRASLGGVRG